MLQLSWQPHPVLDPEREVSLDVTGIFRHRSFSYIDLLQYHIAPREREREKSASTEKDTKKKTLFKGIEDPFPLLSKYHPSFIYSQERFCGSRRGERKKESIC